jgi:hypothetical protein
LLAGESDRLSEQELFANIVLLLIGDGRTGDERKRLETLGIAKASKNAKG